MPPFLFTHIPKTAGTSFRQSLEQYYGPEKLLYDYGANSTLTEPFIVRQYEADTQDVYPLLQRVNQGEFDVIAGHIPVNKYLFLSCLERTLTFVREPVSQVVSHFIHMRDNYGYEQSLEVFITEPRFINLQSRLLQSIPLSLLGFIGVTENYSDSINLFNAIFGLRIKEKRVNKASRSSYRALDVSDELKDTIRELNAKDIALYQKALIIFDERIKCLKNSTPYVYGFFNIHIKQQAVNGIAYYAQSDEMVELEVYVSDTLLATIYAKHFNQHWASVIKRRGGLFGFHFKHQSITADSCKELRVVVKQTGQCLMLHQVHGI